MVTKQTWLGKPKVELVLYDTEDGYYEINLNNLVIYIKNNRQDALDSYNLIKQALQAGDLFDQPKHYCESDVANMLTAVEFGYRQAEKGYNLEQAMELARRNHAG